MEAEIEKDPNALKINKAHVLAHNWQDFTLRALDILADSPTLAKFTIKYIPKTHKFVLKVGDGSRLVMRKCTGDVKQYLCRNCKRWKSLQL
jgi:hypothetical protein